MDDNSANEFLSLDVKKLKRYKSKKFLTSKGKAGLFGSGSYAKVLKCTHPTLGDVAVKCYHRYLTNTKQEEKLKVAEREANILHRISHENIVMFHGIVEWDINGENFYGIVLEEVSGGNLEEFISNSNPKHLEKDVPWGLRLRFFMDLANAIYYLQNNDPRRSFIHGDIKPQNILLTSDLRLKLADFGSCEIVKAAGIGTMSIHVVRNRQHTLLYTAPEYLKADSNIPKTCSMDIYSFSMIGYEIITLTRVYSNSSASHELLTNIIAMNKSKPDNSKLREVVSGISSHNYKQLCRNLTSIVKDCWDHDPKSRLNASEIQKRLEEMQHFFSKELSEDFSTVFKSSQKKKEERNTPLTEYHLTSSQDREDLEQSNSSNMTVTQQNVGSIYGNDFGGNQPNTTTRVHQRNQPVGAKKVLLKVKKHSARQNSKPPGHNNEGARHRKSNEEVNQYGTTTQNISPQSTHRFSSRLERSEHSAQELSISVNISLNINGSEVEALPARVIVPQRSIQQQNISANNQIQNDNNQTHLNSTETKPDRIRLNSENSSCWNAHSKLFKPKHQTETYSFIGSEVAAFTSSQLNQPEQLPINGDLTVATSQPREDELTKSNANHCSPEDRKCESHASLKRSSSLPDMRNAEQSLTSFNFKKKTETPMKAISKKSKAVSFNPEVSNKYSVPRSTREIGTQTDETSKLQNLKQSTSEKVREDLAAEEQTKPAHLIQNQRRGKRAIQKRVEAVGVRVLPTLMPNAQDSGRGVKQIAKMYEYPPPKR